MFTALGFDGHGDEVFRDLVIARVVEPDIAAGCRRLAVGSGPVPGQLRDDETASRPRRYGQVPRPVPPGALRRRPPLLRGREGRRPAQGRVLQGTPEIVLACWSTAAGCLWASAASQATRPRPRPSGRSSSISRPPQLGRHGRCGRRRNGLSGQPVRVGRGGPKVHLRFPDDEGRDRPLPGTSAGTATRSPTGSWSTPSPAGSHTRARTTTCAPKSGTQRCIPVRGGRCGAYSRTIAVRDAATLMAKESWVCQVIGG